MDNLTEALELLKEQLGDFDNIKLLLGAGDMTREGVGAELLRIAQNFRDGAIVVGPLPNEDALLGHAIRL